MIENLDKMPLYKIAGLIRKDWGKVSPFAKPYLDAMYDLSSIKDRYGMDSGESIVAYFLSNATSWKGEVAKEIKKELNTRLKKGDKIEESLKEAVSQKDKGSIDPKILKCIPSAYFMSFDKIQKGIERLGITEGCCCTITLKRGKGVGGTMFTKLVKSGFLLRVGSTKNGLTVIEVSEM